MSGEVISIETAEKIANYDKLNSELKETKEKMEYWKNEHFQLSLKYKDLKKKIKQLEDENQSLKKIMSEVNKGNNGYTPKNMV